MTLEDEIKELIIKALELEDIAPSDIKDEDALFIDGLGLDSIDALELGMALKKSIISLCLLIRKKIQSIFIP